MRNVRKSYTIIHHKYSFPGEEQDRCFWPGILVTSLADPPLTSGVELNLEEGSNGLSFRSRIRVHLPTYFLTSMTLQHWLNSTRAHGTITRAAFRFNSEPTAFINWWYESSSLPIPSPHDYLNLISFFTFAHWSTSHRIRTHAIAKHFSILAFVTCEVTEAVHF